MYVYMLFAAPWTVTHQASHPWNFPGKNTGAGCHFLLQGISPTQEPNLHLIYPLAPPGKPNTRGD